MKIILTTALLCCCFIIACSNEDIPPTKLVNTYAKILLLRNKGVDSTATANSVDSTLRANGYTKESFREELISMNKNPKLFKAFMDSVNYRLR